MSKAHQFGGSWTEQKLTVLRKYLEAYARIFDKNERARALHPWYVDAFAGTGYRAVTQKDSEQLSLIPELGEPDTLSFVSGSARIALEVSPGFHRYLFVDNQSTHCEALEGLRTDFPAKSSKIMIQHGDANSVIKDWCTTYGRGLERAVVFLDPYGMQVEWATIEALAPTRVVDLWLLVPLGIALNRLLTKTDPPEPWARSLTKALGTNEWRNIAYSADEPALFPELGQGMSRTMGAREFGDFIMDRLRSVFPFVAPSPLPLYNSRGTLLYLFCFAAANPKAGNVASRIADDILKRELKWLTTAR